MIARDLILFLLLIILPFVYFDLRAWRKKKAWWKRVCRWIPCLAIVAYTVYLAQEPDFIPGNDRIFILYTYLFIIGLVVIPMWTYIVCSLVGRGCSMLVRKLRKTARPARNYGNLLGLLSIPAVWFVLFWGSFVGFNKLEVNRQEFTSPDLPKAFNGYKIVLFSDAHVGSYMKHNSWVLQRAIDSINAQKPDLIVFTGDLQNKYPEEIEERTKLLARLKAEDGICSVLGNHDYPEYSERDEFHRAADFGSTCTAEKDLGWHLLDNSWYCFRRNGEAIYIAGMENDGEGRFPQLGSLSSALIGLNRQSFVIMLEHNPSSWRRKILPHSHCQLTLSGHTHGGQLSLFGWSSAGLRFREHSGMYYAGQRAINVTTGIGGVVPFRFGTSPEIVVITLRSKR